MANMDDAVFHRGIKLLNSNVEGSEEKMRLLLEEVVKLKYGNSRSLNLSQEPGLKKESGTKITNSVLKKESPKKFGEKRLDNKVLEERSDGSRDSSSGRKSHDHKSTHYKSGSSPSSPRSVSVGLSQSVSMSLLRDLDAGKSDSLRDDDDDLALEILEDDLACVICRGMDVGVRNQLVECLECHSLYHQECHQPPVPDNMNEPRSAWYCANCLKEMNKVANGSLAGNRMPAVNVPSASTSVKPQQHQNSKTASGSNKVFGGFPVPVKSHGSTKSGKSSNSSSSHSKVIVPKINMVSADKRLQIMKKKAAKLQEKRKLTK